MTWTPLNETWRLTNPEVNTRFVQNLYSITKGLDGARPVNDASGDAHIMTDIWSVHNYERDPAKLIKEIFEMISSHIEKVEDLSY